MGFLKIRNITKNYFLGKAIVKALRGIDLEIDKSEFACIIGPSGAGKSTLLNIIGLLDDPTSGELIFDDVPIYTLKEKQIHLFRKEHIGFIFQSFNLIPVLNAYENIEYPLLIKKIKAKERKKRISYFAEEVGIGEYLHHRPDELSGGQRQRVSIVRALVTKPEVIIADEPTANLDLKTGKNILGLLKQLNKEEKTTFIIASHDVKIMELADRVIKVIDGMIEN